MLGLSLSSLKLNEFMPCVWHCLHILRQVVLEMHNDTKPFAKHHAFNSSRVASLCIIFTLEESSVTAFAIKTVPRYYHLTT